MDAIIIILLVTCVLLLGTLIGLSVYTIHRDTTKFTKNFELQMAAAKTNKLPEINKMQYSDLMKIVNETIDYYTTQNMTVLSLTNKSSEEISLVLDELSADIATKVKVGVSKYVSECITCYVTEEFYDRYIINSVRLMLIAQIEKQKRATRSVTTKTSKNKSTTTTQS